MNALTGTALFLLLKQKPDLPRPYRAWGYPVLPLLFIAIILWMVLNEFRQDPRAALSGIAMVAAGIPFFFYFRKGAHA